MRLLVFMLLQISKLAIAFPKTIITLFVALGAIGFATMPLINISTDLTAGVGATDPIINITRENSEAFGEQDALIIVLEFSEPPGEARLPLIRDLGETVASLPGVRRVRYQFLDPEDSEKANVLLKHFLLGMNQREREEIARIFTPTSVKDGFRRNINRLFLTQNPYLQKRILEDPLELGRFVADSMTRRVGSLSLGDMYLLVASPDSTTYLIQITPDFPSADLVRGKALIDLLQTTIPARISELKQKFSQKEGKPKEINWFLTGKTEFHRESDQIFDNETNTILLFSLVMVVGLLIAVYRSFWAGLVLFIPIAAGVGPNYGLIYLTYNEVNPVVMGASGVLFGLGTDYGVHLWGSFRAEIDKGLSPVEAIVRVYEHTGPPVLMGALTSILAFLCLCLSHQPAMGQFGYVGASGLILTLASTLFLFPALAKIMSGLKRDRYPRMRVSFKSFSGLFIRHPKIIVLGSVILVVGCSILALRIAVEKDLFRVFLARNMDSMTVSETISRKFHSNFTQPTLLSFDTDDLQKGLFVQRRLDDILEKLMSSDGQIASFDSISYLMSPESVRLQNSELLSGIASKWPQLKQEFKDEVERSDLSVSAAKEMEHSFDSTGEIVSEIASLGPEGPEADFTELERSWYLAKIKGKYRFLTHIRYSSAVTDVGALGNADRRILEAVKDLPVKIDISGPRQAMQALLSTMMSDLVTLCLYVLAAVVIFFFILFGHPLGVFLSLIPMLGAFSVTLGAMGALGMGLPFSIVGVAPLIFGLGMDNGVHVVMGAMHEGNSSVIEAMQHVTRPIIFTSLTNVMGFVAMLTSKHYSMEFLGWAVVIGMISAVAFTLTTLPALLLLLERRRTRTA
jgi:uncharacterized protein